MGRPRRGQNHSPGIIPDLFLAGIDELGQNHDRDDPYEETYREYDLKQIQRDPFGKCASGYDQAEDDPNGRNDFNQSGGGATIQKVTPKNDRRRAATPRRVSISSGA